MVFRRKPQRARAPIAVRAMLKADTCPGCTAERLAGDAMLSSLITEGVTLPDVRDELRASHMWCAGHLERAVTLAKGDAGQSSIALLYADVLQTLERKGVTWPAPHPVCEVCRHVVDVVPHALRDVAIALERGEYGDELAATAPLCLTHTGVVAGLSPSRGRDRLLERGMAELRETAAQLQDFADRQDYRADDHTDSAGSVERLLRFVRGTEPLTARNTARGRR